MSSESLNMVWQVESNFEQDELTSSLEGFGATLHPPTNEHQLQFWRTNGLVIILYEKSLVAQGVKNERNIRIVMDINELNGLYLDSKNKAKFSALLPESQNALICNECGKPFYLIEGNIEGLDIIFNNECNHKNNIRLPFLMYINRFLPDFNICISKHLSRMINLGYFIGAEILIPKFMMDCADSFLGSRTAPAFRAELESLRELEKQNKITIYFFDDHLEIPSDRTEFDRTEDSCLLEIAKQTNSILITADTNFRERTLLAKRPVVFLSGPAIHALKILEEIRTP